MTTTDNLKQQWRNTLKKLSPRSLSKDNLDQLLALPEIIQAEHLGCYIAIQPEIDLLSFYQALHTSAKKLYIPTLNDKKEMRFVEYDPFQTVNMSHGFKTSHNARLLQASELDCIIVPCLGIDKDNIRLGRGLGYYDRVLTDQIPTITVITASQLIPGKIGESHDAAIKRVITI